MFADQGRDFGRRVSETRNSRWGELQIIYVRAGLQACVDQRERLSSTGARTNFQFEWRLSAYVFVYLICTAPLYGGST